MCTLWPMRDRFKTDYLCREQKDSKQIICAGNKKIPNRLFVQRTKRFQTDYLCREQKDSKQIICEPNKIFKKILKTDYL